MKNIKKIKLKELAITENCILWSKIGQGGLTTLRQKLESEGYKVIEIRAYQCEMLVSDQVLEIQMDSQQKTALVFDELSSNNLRHSEYFKNALEKQKSKDNILVIGLGRIDSHDNLVVNDSLKDVFEDLEHYMIKNSAA